MSDLLFWLADHVALWRPFAIAPLVGFVLLILWYLAVSWETER